MNFANDPSELQAMPGLESILQVLHEGVYIVDKERRIQYWNAAAEAITGYSAKTVIGSRCSDNILRHVSENGQQLCTSACPLQATLEDGKTRDLMVYLHHRDGRRLPVHVRSIALRDETGIPRALEVFNEISDRGKLLAELEILRQEILTDPLTEIGNRRYYELNGEARLAAYRAQKVPFGLLMFDIDHFKAVNDGFGHSAGDSVLKMIAGPFRTASGRSIRSRAMAVRNSWSWCPTVPKNISQSSAEEFACSSKQAGLSSMMAEGSP